MHWCVRNTTWLQFAEVPRFSKAPPTKLATRIKHACFSCLCPPFMPILSNNTFPGGGAPVDVGTYLWVNLPRAPSYLGTKSAILQSLSGSRFYLLAWCVGVRHVILKKGGRGSAVSTHQYLQHLSGRGSAACTSFNSGAPIVSTKQRTRQQEAWRYLFAVWLQLRRLGLGGA